MTLLNSPRRWESAYAIPVTLVFASVSLLVLGGALQWTSSNVRLTDRMNEMYKSMMAAEAATEKVVANIIYDYKVGGEGLILGNMASYRTNIPSSSEESAWGDYTFRDPLGNANRIYVERVNNQVYSPLESQYKGLNGWVSTYKIISNAKVAGSRHDLWSAVQQEVHLASIPVFQYAIFYNELLEFTWAAPFNVRGRAHGNAQVYTGSSAPLTFWEDVTSVGTNQKTPWWGFSMSQFTGSLTYMGQKDTNVAALNLPIGTNNTSAAVHKIIEKPPAGESINSEMGKQRYYNKAEVTAEIDSAGFVTMKLKQPLGTSTTTVPVSEWSTWLYGDSFYDQREGKTMLIAEVDVGAFKTWAETSTNVTAALGPNTPPNLLWIEDNRTVTSSQRTGIRLVNGQTLPDRGLTVATPDGLYVKGHYNCPTSSHLGTTNTSNTKPASLVSDGLTVLSGAWDDAKSTWSYSNRDAVNTTVNAAIVTGTVASAGSSGSNPMSGGVMNITRLIEDWGNGARVLTVNGSIISMFDSQKALGAFQWPGNYYRAPSRNFNFDKNFLDVSKLPPGTPQLRVLLRGKWLNPPPGVTNYVAI